jgi:hypothetical protein
MACEINASPSNGLVQSADGSGVIKLKSNGVTTNALAWVNFNGTGTVAIRSSYNVSSITDNGTADYTVNFTSSLSDINYVPVAQAGNTSAVATNGAESTLGKTYSTSSYRFVLVRADGATVDREFVTVAIFGN